MRVLYTYSHDYSVGGVQFVSRFESGKPVLNFNLMAVCFISNFVGQVCGYDWRTNKNYENYLGTCAYISIGFYWDDDSFTISRIFFGLCYRCRRSWNCYIALQSHHRNYMTWKILSATMALHISCINIFFSNLTLIPRIHFLSTITVFFYM